MHVAVGRGSVMLSGSDLCGNVYRQIIKHTVLKVFFCSP